MGGNIAGMLAHDHPEEVETLTLLEPLGIESRIPSAMDSKIRDGMTPLVPKTAEEFDNLFEAAFVKRPFIPRAVYLQMRQHSLASEALHRLIWNDLWSPEHSYLLEKNLAGIGAPTLVIWGDTNHFLHETALEKLERGLRNVRVVRMKQCGHVPMIERPSEVLNHLEMFIDDKGLCVERP